MAEKPDIQQQLEALDQDFTADHADKHRQLLDLHRQILELPDDAKRDQLLEQIADLEDDGQINQSI